MFHRINESMELGMHPAILYPRRSQIRPHRTGSDAIFQLYGIVANRQDRTQMKVRLKLKPDTTY